MSLYRCNKCARSWDRIDEEDCPFCEQDTHRAAALAALNQVGRPVAPAVVGGREHLNAADMRELGVAVRRVLVLLSDGQWHARTELFGATGNQSESTRRCRELRRYFRVDVERVRGVRDFRYRLVVEPDILKLIRDTLIHNGEVA